jgi:hypothetical protein
MNTPVKIDHVSNYINFFLKKEALFALINGEKVNSDILDSVFYNIATLCAYAEASGDETWIKTEDKITFNFAKAIKCEFDTFYKKVIYTINDFTDFGSRILKLLDSMTEKSNCRV